MPCWASQCGVQSALPCEDAPDKRGYIRGPYAALPTTLVSSQENCADVTGNRHTGNTAQSGLISYERSSLSPL
jgi:hypothetical protein